MITSAEEFVSLRISASRDDYQRAIHESASDPVWHEVIAKYPEMRVWVARNKTVPNSVLQVLASDPSPDVRSSVADVRRLAPALLAALALDTDPSVRLRVVLNRKTPTSVLRQFLQDEWERIAEVAQARLAERIEGSDVSEQSR